MRYALLTTASQDPARSIAVTAGGGFAAFYVFYASAPVAFAAAAPGPGTRVAAAMVLVIAVQPVILIARRWARHRRRTVIASVALMCAGSAVLPWAGHWAGQSLLALGFGAFVVTSTAWAKEAVPPQQVGRSLGLYGFGAAAGGALGAPIGLTMADRFGITGVAVAGAVFAAASLFPAARASAPAVSAVPAAPAESLSALDNPRPDHSDTEPAALGGAVGAALGVAGHLLAVAAYAFALSGITDIPASGGQGSALVIAAAKVRSPRHRHGLSGDTDSG
ncbi:hypothetical protein GCM10009676_26990 [Prauserella halophila]|uniref:MFS transporter n=1 Tax=Prauserella halophila TaxID=185641 RepID=A0ABN1W902_9PSEU|nr:hypothetical protein [Prauserella halophila]MCP2235072.1 hypothetical protein [Prauserella halophila]